MEKESITEEDVAVICSEQTENKIFDMINAMAEKKQKKAMELYYDLLALKEPPMRILFLMTREYRLLFHVKGLMANGYGKKEIASKAGIHPFAAGRYMDAAKRYELGELRTVMEEGAQLEQNVKTGLMTDTLAVELFIVKNSGKQ